MARNPIVFENGTLVSNAKVEINGVIYDVEPEIYEGTTPLSASNLNQLQNNLYDYVDNEIKSKVTSLWKGEKNTTGSVTLSDAYSNYDLIAFTIASNNTPNRKTEFVWAKDIIINGELNLSIFQSSSVWVAVSGTFTSTTNFNIGELHKQTWNSVYLIEISGIKL